MKRFFRLVPAVMAAAVISVCSACGAEPPSEESLLTPEELIRAAGLTKEHGRRYRTSNEYLFSDLGQAEPEDYADGQQMAEALDEYGEVREMLLSGEHSGI